MLILSFLVKCMESNHHIESCTLTYIYEDIVGKSTNDDITREKSIALHNFDI